MRSSDGEGLNIEPIAHPILVPLVLLAPRNLQSRVPLLPLRHKRAATILSYKPLSTHLLRLALKLKVCAKHVQIRFSTIGLAGPTKLTQSEKSVGSKVVDLEIKFLKNLTKELNRREAKAASKKVLENDSIIPIDI